MIMHLCLKLPLDDTTCMCMSSVAGAIALISYVAVVWRIGR